MSLSKPRGVSGDNPEQTRPPARAARTPAGEAAAEPPRFLLRETPDPFRKAVQVLHSRPKSPLSLLQRKLGNAWLKHAIEHPPDAEGWWEIGIKDLAAVVGFDSHNRQYLKNAAEALMRVVFDWDVIATAERKVQWKASVLFPEVEVLSDAVRYQFSAQMRELLIHPEIYALIDMRVVRRFRRAASLAIWEFCIRFERIGRTAEVPWEKFRDMMLGEDSGKTTYREYKFFKAKVLNPGIAEINALSHHTIGLVETRIGRRVAGIAFLVSRRPEPDAAPITPLDLERVGELVRLGVPQSEARKICRDFAPERIQGALAYTKRRMADGKAARIDHPAAYFRKALSAGYAPAAAPEGGAAPPAAGRPRGIDLRAAHAAQRAGEAARYFAELDPGEQNAIIDRYNATQTAAPLRLDKRAGKLAQAGFFRWLAGETWGEPSAEELLEFAQGLLSA